MDGGIVVVTVDPVDKNIAAAGFDVISVFVGVGAGAGTVLVDLTVTVVVFAVTADLGRVGMDGGIVVVTVDPVDKGVAAAGFDVISVFVGVGAGGTGTVLVDLTVAVVV